MSTGLSARVFTPLTLVLLSITLLFFGCTDKTDSVPRVVGGTNQFGEVVLVARSDQQAESNDVYLFAFKHASDTQLVSQFSETAFTTLSLDSDRGELVLVTDQGARHVLSVGGGDRSEEVIEGRGLARYPRMSAGDPQESLNELVESGLRLMLPEGLECQSGGPGALNCGVSSWTFSCQVWCDAGNETEYACCRPHMEDCGCVNSAD